MPENNQKNRFDLASAVVDDMDTDCLMEFAHSTMTDLYKLNQDHFEEDWEYHMEDADDDDD